MSAPTSGTCHLASHTQALTQSWQRPNCTIRIMQYHTTVHMSALIIPNTELFFTWCIIQMTEAAAAQDQAEPSPPGPTQFQPLQPCLPVLPSANSYLGFLQLLEMHLHSHLALDLFMLQPIHELHLKKVLLVQLLFLCG